MVFDQYRGSQSNDEEPDGDPFIEDNVKQKEFLHSFGFLKLVLGATLFLSLLVTIFGFVGLQQTKI